MTFENLNLTKEQKELLQQISEEVELLNLIGAPQELYDELHKEVQHILFNPPEPEEIFKVHGYEDTRKQLQDYLAKRFLKLCETCWHNVPMSTHDCSKQCHLWEKFRVDALTYGLQWERLKITEPDITIIDLICDKCPDVSPNWLKVFVNRYGVDVFPVGTVIEILY